MESKVQTPQGEIPIIAKMTDIGVNKIVKVYRKDIEVESPVAEVFFRAFSDGSGYKCCSVSIGKTEHWSENTCSWIGQICPDLENVSSLALLVVIGSGL